MKSQIIRCEYNMDNCRVEVEYCDGRMILINTLAIEDAVDANMIQRAALVYLIYNKPHEYEVLVLNGGLEEFVKGTSKKDYGIEY